MNFVWLWGDVLLWLSAVLIAISTYHIFKSKDLKEKWQQIFASPVALISFLIFCLYFGVGLLDSVHFQPKNQSNYVSLLDGLLVHAKNKHEKSYSAPLAYQSFTKTSLDNGQRGFKPLKNIAYGITNDAQHQQHLWQLSQPVLVLFVILLVLLLLLFWLKSRFYLQKNWRYGLIAISLILVLLFWIAQLLPYYHLFGTDKAGVDVFYKAIKSIRTSLIFGLVTTLIATPIGVFFGLSAGYFKGFIDDMIQFFYTSINAMPNILLIAALVVMVQVYITQNVDIFDSNEARADMKLLLLCLVIALTSWTSLCRIIRAESLKLSQLEFVQSAQIFALKHRTILRRHLLPNVMHLVMISMVLDFSALVLTESVLSYVGIGVDSSMYSWGNMINNARLELAKTPIVWWSLGASFLLMFILVLAVNLFADKVRQVFDPKTH